MPVYERRTTIDAPLSEVWGFHSRVTGLEAITPDWMGLCVEFVIGSDGTPDPDCLEVGSELELSIRPFGVGPRQYTRSEITAREREAEPGTDREIAYFRDEMLDGPFDEWVHTHAFVADGDRTVLRDHVAYELPGSRLGGIGRLTGAVSPLSNLGFECMFRARHRQTKARLE